MDAFTWAHGRKVKNMVSGNSIGRMDLFMKENGRMTICMAKAE
jgi:hypothetical protein